MPVLVQGPGGRRWSKAEAAGWREPPVPRVCAAGGARGSLVCPLTCWGLRRCWGGYIRRVVLAGGASLAVLRGRGSLSVFVLLLLHLLHDFPDLALGSLGGTRNGGWGSTHGHTRASQPAFNPRPSTQVIVW